MHWNKLSEYLIPLKDGNLVDIDVYEDREGDSDVDGLEMLYAADVIFKFSDETVTMIDFQDTQQNPTTQTAFIKMLLANSDYFKKFTINGFIKKMEALSEGATAEAKAFYKYIKP